MLDRVSADSIDGILQVQRAIIQLCRSFCLSDENNGDALAVIYNEYHIGELTTVSKFLAGTDTRQANRLLLHGLLMFAEDVQRKERKSLQEFMLRFIEQVGNNIQFGSFIKKAAIVQFIYSSESIESFFLKRWIQTEASANNAKVASVYDLTKEPKSINTNRFWCRAAGDIWTAEEKRFVAIIGREAATQLLQNETPAQYLQLLQKATAQQIKEQLIQICQDTDPTDEDQVKQFHERFEFSRSSARGLEYEWTIWLNEVVIKSLKSSSRFNMKSVGQLLAVSEDYSFEQLLRTTLSSRPHQWLDNLLVCSVIDAACTIYGSQTLGSVGTSEWDLRIFINRLQGPARKLLYVLLDQLEDESERQLKRDDKDLESFKQLLASLKTLDKVPDTIIYRFKELPLSRWPKRIRHLQLSQKWSKSLANRLTKLDCSLGPKRTDKFLEKFVEQHPSDTAEEKKKKLDVILKHLFKYTWLFEELELVISESGEDKQWKLLENERAIIDEMKATESSSDLKDFEIIRKLAEDESNNLLDQKLLLEQMKEIKNQREAEWIQVDKWIADVKEGKVPADIVNFLSVACIVVENLENYYPRDTQLLAVLILSGSSNRKISCMAEISTGEGKTLITALFAIYLSLSGRNNKGTGCVNVVTSSPVLAEENVTAVASLFQRFGVSVGNNCDQDCSDDEDKRRERYKNDVIYGDLSSFQRDELISRFFGRDVTRNRKADAIIVDEVIFSYIINVLNNINWTVISYRWTVCCWTREKTFCTCRTKFRRWTTFCRFLLKFGKRFTHLTLWPSSWPVAKTRWSTWWSLTSANGLKTRKSSFRFVCAISSIGS